MHDIRYDELHDEFVVTNPFAQAVLTFRGGANGDEAPIRIIQGPSTQMNNPDRVDIDPIHNEIVAPDSDRILVYPRTASGDTAPLRTIHGPDTGVVSVQSLAVDPVNNLIIAGTNPGGGREGPPRMLIYDRLADGNVKPLRIIEGPHTGISRINQIQVYTPKNLLIAAQPGFHDDEEPEEVFIGIWNVNDSGDTPPRWKLGGPGSVMKKPRGVVLDLKHKELIVADMRLNAVLTYYFPELF